jgi:hypothetical protein
MKRPQFATLTLSQPIAAMQAITTTGIHSVFRKMRRQSWRITGLRQLIPAISSERIGMEGPSPCQVVFQKLTMEV